MSVPPGDSMLEFDPVVRRRGRDREGAVRVDKAKLQRDPRGRSDIAKRAGSWTMRAIAFGGMNMEDLDDATRSSLGLMRRRKRKGSSRRKFWCRWMSWRHASRKAP